MKQEKGKVKKGKQMKTCGKKEGSQNNMRSRWKLKLKREENMKK